LMGVMLAMICMGFGMNAGNSMNPARDFGPRLFSWMAGYEWEVFRWISRVEKSRKCRKKTIVVLATIGFGCLFYAHLLAHCSVRGHINWSFLRRLQSKMRSCRRS
jgi:glycerol uptake facilitator-like aquaporin